MIQSDWSDAKKTAALPISFGNPNLPNGIVFLYSFKRCLGNLIDNGLAYGKKVEIYSKKTMNNLLIFVDDDGPGIPEKEYQNVIKPFYRIDKSRGQNKSGVGLGLSIANDIIRSHGGNISLNSSPLRGLRVKISLPL